MVTTRRLCLLCLAELLTRTYSILKFAIFCLQILYPSSQVQLWFRKHSYPQSVSNETPQFSHNCMTNFPNLLITFLSCLQKHNYLDSVYIIKGLSSYYTRYDWPNLSISIIIILISLNNKVYLLIVIIFMDSLLTKGNS